MKNLKFVTREKFLQMRKDLMSDMEGISPEVIIVNPEEDIICDWCNADVDGPEIGFDLWGAYCNPCLKKKGVAIGASISAP